jgi:hypothetical protein
MSGENHHMFGKTGENNPMFGKCHTAETIAKIQAANSGENHPFYGKTHTPETKAKMSAANQGKIHSEETKRLMSEARLGKYTGSNNPFYGKSHTAETIAKLNKKVYVYTINSATNIFTMYKCFNSYTETATYFNCTNRTISNYIDKNKLFKNQYFLFSSVQSSEAMGSDSD